LKIRSLGALFIGLILLVGLVWFLLPPSEGGKVSSRESVQAPAAGVMSARSQKQEAEEAPGPTKSLVQKSPVAPLDELARKKLRAALSQARAQRVRGEGRGVVSAGARPTASPLDIANKTGAGSEWEERQLETMRELLGECYDVAAEEEPGLAGTFGLRFSLSAEPDIGGLVDDVAVMEEYSSIEQATMRECMLNSVYALELDPPPEGVRIEREITLRFDEEQ